MVELLSPAGTFECFKAALSAGADAVYAGLKKFGARAFAGNLSEEEFAEAIDLAHLFGKRVYLTLNILIKDREFPDIERSLTPLYEAGLDGVILQDLGLISFIRENYPGLDIHISTQAAATGYYSACFFKELGAKRVVAARELSLDEIKRMKEARIEVECFIHGAMCYSCSGLCLMSSFLGGRSGNRGRCAGPCRQPIRAGGKEGYYLSMKDMCLYDHIEALILAGVDSLKIEGRMKNKEYVYFVTGLYRDRIDSILNGETADKGNDKELLKVYSRGESTDAYLTGDKDKLMVTVKKGNYMREMPSVSPDLDALKRKADLRAEFFTGKEALLTLSSGDARVRVKGSRVEKAEKRGISYEEILKQLMKTGGSGFYFEEPEIVMDDDIFLPVSGINELRRNALKALKEEILREYRRSL